LQSKEYFDYTYYDALHITGKTSTYEFYSKISPDIYMCTLFWVCSYQLWKLAKTQLWKLPV